MYQNHACHALVLGSTMQGPRAAGWSSFTVGGRSRSRLGGHVFGLQTCICLSSFWVVPRCGVSATPSSWTGGVHLPGDCRAVLRQRKGSQVVLSYCDIQPVLLRSLTTAAMRLVAKLSQVAITRVAHFQAAAPRCVERTSSCSPALLDMLQLSTSRMAAVSRRRPQT